MVFQSRMDVKLSIPDRLKKKPQEKTAEPVYAAGDTVIHPSEGICVIDKIDLNVVAANPRMLYYILKPTMSKSESTVYLPVNRGNTLLRALLTKEEIDQIILDSVSFPSVWIDDNKLRKESFTALLSEGNHVKLIRMIRDIHDHNEMRLAEGKKPCAADEAILAEAERLLHQEFAFVLDIPISDIPDYIISRVKSVA